MDSSARRSSSSSRKKGLLWRLPAVRTPELGKLGPAFGYGVGCGVGLGVGLVGGAGIGFGLPGLQFGAGIGAGCGIGIGLGYGVGLGRAYDENGKHNNLFLKKGVDSPVAQIGDAIDNFVIGLTRALDEIEGKRRR